MKRLMWAVGVAALVCGASVSAQGVSPQVLEKYLTKEGKLTSAVEVRDEKKGFGTFYGQFWRIEPDGQWQVTGIYLNKPYATAVGKLSKEEVKELATTLAVFDPLTLPSVGQPLVNPHVITIYYGANQARLVFGVDQVLPRVVVAPLPEPLPPFVAKVGKDDPKKADPKEVEPKKVDPKEVDPKKVDPKEVDPKKNEPNPFVPAPAPQPGPDLATRYGGIQNAVRGIIERNHGKPIPTPKNPRIEP
jgi:hypothetical protein